MRLSTADQSIQKGNNSNRLTHMLISKALLQTRDMREGSDRKKIKCHKIEGKAY